MSFFYKKNGVDKKQKQKQDDDVFNKLLIHKNIDTKLDFITKKKLLEPYTSKVPILKNINSYNNY